MGYNVGGTDDDRPVAITLVVKIGCNKTYPQGVFYYQHWQQCCTSSVPLVEKQGVRLQSGIMRWQNSHGTPNWPV